MIESQSNIAIVILAAGASKRMGFPKQALKWGDTSLLGHTIETALEVHSREVIVVLGANYEYIKENINHSSVAILNNKNWEMGMGTSIAEGIKYLINMKYNVDGVLIILADQPMVTNDYLELMTKVFCPNKKEIVATSYEETNGVPVLFDKSYFEELSELNDDHGAKHVLKKYQFNVKTLTPPMKNIDLDTKEDYDIYRRLQYKN